MSASASKAAKKNQKRAEKRAKERAQKLKEDGVIDRLMQKDEDPMEKLKAQLQEAKNNKDHKLAAKLRKDIWVMQDTMAGQLPPGEDELFQTLDKEKNDSENISETDTTSNGSSLETQKRLRSLKKKLQQIEKLKCKQEDGETLEELQVAKIHTEESVLKEIDELEKLLEQAKVV